MLRLLGFLVVLALCGSGIGYYQGWFAFSSSSSGQTTHINLVVDKQKIDSDEATVKRKLGELSGKKKEPASSQVDTSK